MKRLLTITASEMREINRTAILELVRLEGPTSRSYIAKKLKISLPTVMRILGELLEDNLLVELDHSEWSGGRRRSLIDLNTSGNLTVGLDLGGTKFYGAVTDLGGNILYERTLSRHNTKGEASYKLVVDLITRLLEEARKEQKRIMGIGIGVPGVTYHDTGVVEWAPSLEWKDFPLKERIEKEFNMTTIVDNDVNLSALGELWFGAGVQAENMVMINIGTGIGAGVVIDGALYRGTHQMAGEIGYLMPGLEFLEDTYPEFGALEMLTAGVGITKRAREVLESMGASDKAAKITTEDVFQAYKDGETWSNPVVESTIDYLAIALAAITTFFDPDLIVLAGGVMKSADIILPPLQERMEGRIPHMPEILISQLINRAAVLGAMINLLHNISNFYVVRKFS